MFKKDNLPFGIVLGAIAPLFGFLGYYFWKFYPTFSLKDFFDLLMAQTTLISGLSTFALLINVALLTVYLNRRLDKTAKGIFAISVLYALVALAIKFTS
jgi:hypothetical protein